ncbi:MAG: LysE family transporter [Elusimicrobia bacterium]|nr:LysE family transporter [Elusimicrobiota bacterium]
MFKALLAGGLAGLVAGFVVGPGVMLLIYESLRKGRGAGVLFATGIFAGNFLLLILIHLGAAHIFSSSAYRSLSGWGGAAVFALIGLISILGSFKENQQVLPKEPTNSLKESFLKGFSLCFITPFSLVFLAGIYSTALYAGYTDRPLLVFLFTLLIMLLAGDIIKALLADKLSKFLSDSTMKSLEGFAGYLFLGISAYIIWSLLSGRI